MLRIGIRKYNNSGCLVLPIRFIPGGTQVILCLLTLMTLMYFK